MRRSAALATAMAVVLFALLAEPSGCTATPRPAGAPSSSQPSAPVLPAEPRLLFEWYVPAQQGKTQFLAAQDGSGAVPVTRDVAPGTEHVHSDWSPDGTRIAFEALSPDGPASIWVTDADGSNGVATIACESERCLQQSFPAWSPDGGAIMFVQYDQLPDSTWGPSSIVVVDVATRERSTVATTLDGASAFYSPRWSPDGRQVVAQYETYPDASESEIASSAIVVMPADGAAAPVTLTDPAMFAGHPDWSPTHDVIVFDTYDLSAFDVAPAPSNLFVMQPDGSAQRQLTSTTLEDGERIGEPSWTPTGDRIIAAVGRFTGTGPLTSAEVVTVDPETGEITESGTLGAQPRLQPVP